MGEQVDGEVSGVADASAAGNDQALQQPAAGESSGADAAAATSDAGAAGEQQGKADASSAATGDEPPKTALEAAKRATARARKASEAIEEGRGAKPAPASAEQDQPGGDSEQQTDVDLTGRVPEAEWKALPPITRKRLTALRGHVTTMRAEAERVAPKVQTYDELEGYIRNAGLGRDDFIEALEIMRLTKADPAQAYKRLQPILTTLRQHVGEVLPEDLAAQVAAGTVSEEAARAHAFERAERARLAEQARARDEREAAESATSRAREEQGQAVEALRTLENGWKASDPDYGKKAELVWERMVVLMQSEQKPLTPQNVTAIARRAKDDVEKRLAGMFPAPRAKAPVTETGASRTHSAAPRTALEAAKLALKASAA